MTQQTAIDFPGSRRIHIGLAVRDLERSTRFYQTLLGVAPTKQRPGYVKFEPTDPSVNLVLNQVNRRLYVPDPSAHFGIQVKSPRAVEEAVRRLETAGLDTQVEKATTCCYAVQDKVWVTDPDGNRWEVFVVLDADADLSDDANASCCGSADDACTTASHPSG